MKASIHTPSSQDASRLVEALKNPANAVDAVQATGNTVDAVINKDVDAALELLSQLVTAQPQYIGLGLNSPLSDSLKQTANILRNRRKQIDDAVDGSVGNVGNHYNQARTPRRTDPLTLDLDLDLDGDGIETVAANGYSGAMFDINNDSVKVATGWVKGDDGILVWDKNHNNIADNGAELFGQNAVSANAAANEGVNYLASLDANADGKINNQDAAFADLRVWRDMNGDGTSQTGELLTLDQAGIASLSTSFTVQNTNLNNGNSQISTGTYTRTDGSTGQTGDLALQQQSIYSRFTTPVALTSQALALPGLHGMVRDAANMAMFKICLLT